MSLKRTVEPAAQLVSVDEAKDHCRIEVADDDAYVDALISAATGHIEQVTGRSLVTQTWRLRLDAFPADGEIVLPKPPLQSVSSITYIDSDGATQTLAADQYDVHTDDTPGRVTRAYGVAWPATRRQPNAVTVTYVTGYGSTGGSVPEAIRHAALLIVEDLYRERGDTITGTVVARLRSVDRILSGYKLPVMA